jgi:hypothetical protein
VELQNKSTVFEHQKSDPTCGRDWHEAEAAGCRYDIMASRWYSNECFNDEVLNQMLTEVQFDWFWDIRHSKPATLHDALSGRYDLYPLHHYHIMHCLYQWRRLHLAIIEHRQIDDHVYDYGHTLHCTRLIMGWPKEIQYGKNTSDYTEHIVSHCMPNSL